LKLIICTALCIGGFRIFIDHHCGERLALPKLVQDSLLLLTGVDITLLDFANAPVSFFNQILWEMLLEFLQFGHDE
jgi:hypothetical protein